MASEDALAAGRIAGAFAVIGSANRDRGDRGLRSSAALAGTQSALFQSLGDLHEGHADQVRAGLHGNAKLIRCAAASASTTTATASAAPAACAADRHKLHTRSVHTDLEVVLLARRSGEVQLEVV